MQRIFGIALVCGLIWLGVVAFTEGTDGLLRWLPGRGGAETEANAESGSGSPLDRIRERGAAARDQQLGRIERQLGPETDAAPD